VKKLKLSQNEYALVDNEDFEKVSKFKWSFDPKGYAFRNTDKSVPRNLRRIIYLHREILDAQKGQYCDHINHNKLDNRRSNLRICTNAQNIQNRKIGKNNTNGYKGIQWHTQDKLWQASITVNKKRISLGYWKTAKLAALAYNEGAKKYHGEYALLNKI
jgi:hypothetical protein